MISESNLFSTNDNGLRRFKGINNLVEYVQSVIGNRPNLIRDLDVYFDEFNYLSEVPLIITDGGQGSSAKILVLMIDSLGSCITDPNFDFDYEDDILKAFKLSGIAFVVTLDLGRVLVYNLNDYDLDFIYKLFDKCDIKVVDSTGIVNLKDNLMMEEVSEVQSEQDTDAVRNKIIALPNEYVSFFKEGSFHKTPNGEFYLRCKNSVLHDFIVKYCDNTLSTVKLHYYISANLDDSCGFKFDYANGVFSLSYICDDVMISSLVSTFFSLLSDEYDYISRAVLFLDSLLYTPNVLESGDTLSLVNECELYKGYTLKVFSDGVKSITITPSLGEFCSILDRDVIDKNKLFIDTSDRCCTLNVT